MKEQQDQQRKERKPYRKPVLKKVELRPVESVLGIAKEDPVFDPACDVEGS